MQLPCSFLTEHEHVTLSQPQPTPPTQQEHITDPTKLREVKRVIYGFNEGAPVSKSDLAQEVVTAAATSARPFDLQAYAFKAAQEQLRGPRVVRIGLVQNAIVEHTTAPFEEQRKVGRACFGDAAPAVV